MKNCPKCGVANPDDAKVCENCQNKFGAAASRVVLIGAIALVLLLLGEGIYYYFFVRAHQVPPPPPPEPKKVVVQPRPTSEDLGASSIKGMVLIKAGNFWMGSDTDEEENSASEYPRHKVWLDAYYIDKDLVTFDQFDAFCDHIGKPHVNDQGWGRGKRPAINMTWQDADEYCQWAGKRLPTEAEWEKAAKGGTDTVYFWGDEADAAGQYAWYAGNSDMMTQPIGMKKANPYGLRDMVGNVWQWMSDWYDPDYYPKSPSKNPAGPDIKPKKGKFKSQRGSSFFFPVETLRVMNRYGDDPKHASIYTGCRCAKTPEQPTPEADQ